MKKRKKKGYLLSLFFIAVIIAACMGMAHSAQGVYHEEIQLVENEIDLYFYDSQIEAGPLDGGIAVMVDTNGAYWVHEGTVYAANGQAKAWSPGLSSSPDGITWNSVFWAVKKEK